MDDNFLNEIINVMDVIYNIGCDERLTEENFEHIAKAHKELRNLYCELKSK